MHLADLLPAISTRHAGVAPVNVTGSVARPDANSRRSALPECITASRQGICFEGAKFLQHIGILPIHYSTSTLSAAKRSVITSSTARKYQSVPPPPESVSMAGKSLSTVTFALSEAVDAPTPARSFAMRDA